MKNKRNRIVGLGIVCVLLAVAAAWYTTVYNEGRLLAPMEASDYVFRVQDLPMLAASVLLVLYVGYLVVLCVQKGRADRLKAQAKADNITLGLIFLEVLLLGQGKLMGSVEMTLAALVAAVSLSIALGLFLREYLLYRYDSDELLDEGEE